MVVKVGGAFMPHSPRSWARGMRNKKAPLLSQKDFYHQVEQRGGKSKYFEEDMKKIELVNT